MGELFPFWAGNQCDKIWRNLATLAKFRIIWPFSIWQNLEPTLANFEQFLANVHCYKGPDIEQIVWPSGHAGVDDLM